MATIASSTSLPMVGCFALACKPPSTHQPVDLKLKQDYPDSCSTARGHQMKFGEKVRAARRAKNLDLRTLAGVVGVHFTYLSKIENEKLDFGDYPGEQLILRLAEVL